MHFALASFRPIAELPHWIPTFVPYTSDGLPILCQPQALLGHVSCFLLGTTDYAAKLLGHTRTFGHTSSLMHQLRLMLLFLLQACQVVTQVGRLAFPQINHTTIDNASSHVPLLHARVYTPLDYCVWCACPLTVHLAVIPTTLLCQCCSAICVDISHSAEVRDGAP